MTLFNRGVYFSRGQNMSLHWVSEKQWRKKWEKEKGRGKERKRVEREGKKGVGREKGRGKGKGQEWREKWKREGGKRKGKTTQKIVSEMLKKIRGTLKLNKENLFLDSFFLFPCLRVLCIQYPCFLRNQELKWKCVIIV